MRALNLLKAAPGQDNRSLFRDYLQAKGFIRPEQTPEDWPLFAVPKTKNELAQLAEAVEIFHMELAQGQLQEEQS